jgi:hypothetical protein
MDIYPYFILATKNRKDPLGPGFLTNLTQNLVYQRAFQQREHMVSGEHNTMNVPRVCREINWSGSAYSASPSASDISSISNPAVGTVTLTLASGRFSTSMRPQINFKGTGVATKPWMVGWNVTSATSLTIYLAQLSSALGAGNSWAATDGSFDLAIHSDPLDIGTWSATPPLHQRGDTLTNAATDWNAMAQAQIDMYSAFGSGHSTANGTHAVREAAKAYASVQDTGGAYALASGAGHSSNVSSVSRTGTGICVVTYSAMTTPTQAFPCPDYQRTLAGDPALYVVQAAQTSSTQSTVYIYKYDTGAKTWSLADADFFIAVHGG